MEWKLKDLTVDGKGFYGIGAPAVPYQEDKLTYLRIRIFNDDGSLNFSDLKSVDAEDAEKYILKENDIVFARTGNSTGRSYFYEKQHGTLVYAGFLIKFSLDPNKVNPRILKYYTHSKPYFDWVNSFDTGATRGNINAKTYGDMEIELPSRKVQDKIVSILSSLDRKIELNNKINADLEEMAQAIFKNWFVDFEPFKDGKFVDSELGMIPEGWKVGSPYEYVKVVYGAPYKSAKFNDNGEGLPLIRIRDLKDCNPQFYTPEILPQTEYVNMGDIVAGMDAEFIPHIWKGNTGLLNQRVCKLMPQQTSISNLFVLYLMKPELEFVQSYKTGTTVSHLGKADIDKFVVVLPPLKVVEECSKILDSILQRIKNISAESRTLSLLRDTLLPRLMSGEIEIPE